MRSLRIFVPTTILVAGLALSLFAADKDKKEAASKESPRPSYELPQPEKESLDLAMYHNIREEALAHSHIMEYATGLMDGIGPRLTGSPNLRRANEWTRDQFTAMGCSNAHVEDWGGWHGLAATKHLGAYDFSRHRRVHRASRAMVPRDEGRRHRARNLGQHQGRSGL
jgi:hypothetical protein